VKGRNQPRPNPLAALAIRDIVLRPILDNPNTARGQMTAETTESARRQREWRARRRASWRQRCASCGGIFNPARRDAIYCSDACVQAAYRDRKAGAESPRWPRNGPWLASASSGPPSPVKPLEAAQRPILGRVPFDVRAMIG
jgi:hypothetical protein